MYVPRHFEEKRTGILHGLTPSVMFDSGLIRVVASG
jgi:hypothetical protein